MKEKITKAEFINTWASEWDEITGWKVSEEYHKQFSEQLESIINQEVEKRIAERMPSEEDAKKQASNNGWAMYNEMAGFMRCYRWLRSRLLLTQDQKKDKQQVDN